MRRALPTYCRQMTAAGLVLALSACTVGPDYHPPAAPADSAYRIDNKTAGNTGAATSGKVSIPPQVFERARQVEADWYQIFGSQKLDALITEAIKDNPTLAAGRARIHAAQAVVNQSRAALYPDIAVNAGYQRKKVTGAQFGINNPEFANTFNFYEAQATASYDLDLFGKTRRQIEATNAALDEQRYQVINTYVTLINNIVTSAVAEAGVNASIDTTKKLIASQSAALSIVKKQIALGAAIQANATQLRSQLAQTRASLVPLEKQKALAINRLAILVGTPPGVFQDPDFTLNELQLPQHLPVSLPSQLVNQRPDILAAAAAVHEASARIGVATADLLPDIDLTASYSRQGVSIGDLGNPANALYVLGAQLTQPIFEGGRLRAQRRQAKALYAAALAEYRATTLSAFGQVADALRSISADARALIAQQDALQAARTSLTTARTQLQAGAADYIGLYEAEAQYQSAKLDFTQARLTRYRDTADLFRALGGGWAPGDALPAGESPRGGASTGAAQTATTSS